MEWDAHFSEWIINQIYKQEVQGVADDVKHHYRLKNYKNTKTMVKFGKRESIFWQTQIVSSTTSNMQWRLSPKKVDPFFS